MMRREANQFTLVAGFATLICALLLATALIGEGAPDIVWSNSDHTNAVNSLAFSLDGSRVASGSSNATIRIWQASTGSAVIILTNRNTSILQVAFHGDSRLASWDASNALMGWQLSNGTSNTLREITGIGWSTAFSGNGNLFATAAATTLDVWRVADGTLLRTLVPDQRSSPAFSPDGYFVAAGLGFAERYELKVWQLSDGALVRAFTNYQSGISLYGAPVFSPDGTRIAALTGPYGGTEIWNLQSGDLWRLIPEETQAPGQSVNVKLLVFTPDGRIAIMSDRDDKIRIWRLTNGQEIARLALYDVETAGINALAMSPKGDLFAFGRLDGKVVVARVPLFITKVTSQGNQFVLQWAGGSGLSQLQQRTNLIAGNWENVGSSTTASGYTNTAPVSTVFYRLQSLPNP